MSATDGPTGFVSTHDDILQMLASLEQRDLNNEHLSETLASGLSPERQIGALTNIARLLVTALTNELELDKGDVYSGVRHGVLTTIAGGATDSE